MGCEVDKLTVRDAVAGLRAGVFSSVELTHAVLDACASRNPASNAFLWMDEADAMRQADTADAARRAGADGALLGVPLAIKDILNVEGQPCSCGSKILKGYISVYDATAIARLRTAGALFVGRTNLDEFAMGSTTENSAFGPSRNPANFNYVAGGSSGGSAAAVAGGLALAALGTDTGGSIRQPASFCGCVGLKPSYGRVSRYGLVAYASSLDQVGPITRTVADAALLLGVMAGRDPLDATTLDQPGPDYTQALREDLRGLRLGMPREYFVDGMNPEVAASVRSAVERCRELGAEIVEVSLPHTEYAVATYYIICTAEASSNLARYDGVKYGMRVEGKDIIEMYKKTRSLGFGKEVKRRIILGTYVLSSGYYDAYYRKAGQVRTLIRKDFDNAFEQCDLIATAVSPTTAFRIGEKTEDPLTMYLSDIFTIPVNLAGLPALSLPCGFDRQGLPIGLQLIGKPLDEARILQVASVLEGEKKLKKIPDMFG